MSNMLDAMKANAVRAALLRAQDRLKGAALESASAVLIPAERVNASRVVEATKDILEWGLAGTDARDVDLRYQAIRMHHSNVMAGRSVQSAASFLTGVQALYKALAAA